MTARCIDCNKWYNFKAAKGAKLPDRRCTCGGKYELLDHEHDEIRKRLGTAKRKEEPKQPTAKAGARGDTKWVRYRFRTKSVDDYRPLVFNPKYPWWCSGYSGDVTEAIIIAYLPPTESLNTYWDDAFDIEQTEEREIVFTDRFPKARMVYNVTKKRAIQTWLHDGNGNHILLKPDVCPGCLGKKSVYKHKCPKCKKKDKQQP